MIQKKGVVPIGNQSTASFPNTGMYTERIEDISSDLESAINGSLIESLKLHYWDHTLNGIIIEADSMTNT